MLVNRDIWFVQTPTQVSRTTYGTDPFPEAQLVASYIRANSSPEAHVAILGSEPEIYFLSRRHSATGYIYTYGLMEPQPFARQMQGEMIREIETDAPKFVVFADNIMSWWRYHTCRLVRRNFANGNNKCLGHECHRPLWRGSRQCLGNLSAQNHPAFPAGTFIFCEKTLIKLWLPRLKKHFCANLVGSRPF
jgi:hypothetical protein